MNSLARCIGSALCGLALLGCQKVIPITLSVGGNPIPPGTTYYVGHARASDSPTAVGTVVGVPGVITRIAVITEAGIEPSTYTVVTGTAGDTQMSCTVLPQNQMCTSSENLVSLAAMTRVGVKVVNPSGNTPLLPTITLLFLPD